MDDCQYTYLTKLPKKMKIRKKKPDNTGFFVTYGGLVLWWWHAFLVSILGLGFRVQIDGKSQTVRHVTIVRASLNSSPSCVLLASVNRDGNVVSWALFLDPRLCFFFKFFLWKFDLCFFFLGLKIRCFTVWLWTAIRDLFILFNL